MVTRSEPLLIPFFFAFCIHFSLFLLLGYWKNPQSELESLSLGPSIEVALAPLPVAPPPEPVRPVPPQPPSPAQPQPEREAPREQPKAETETPPAPPIEAPKPLRPQDEKERTKKEEKPEIPTRAAAPPERAADVQEFRSRALVYYERNKVLVERNFNPGTAAQRNQFQGLVTRLKIFLDEQGRLTDVDIIASSGNRVFDVEAERAV